VTTAVAKSAPVAERASVQTRKPKFSGDKYFLPYQRDWILDGSRLKICEKGRQIGMSYADAYDSVRKAAATDGRDVWVMSRDEMQARQYLLYCKRWARILNYAAQEFTDREFVLPDGKTVKVQQLEFASGASIYALSSNPDAIVGKTGHVKIDEYAIHKSQRDLFAIAKQVTQWGGTLSLISTHRGIATQFNQFIRDIKERGNPMGWSLHTIPIQRAVADGIVEKINDATGGTETREQWLARQRRECVDEEHWLQEFCCVPADESSAFISYDLITGCEDDSARKDFNYLLDCKNPIFIGFDVARTQHLSVIDVEEKVGDVLWERLRVELRGATFATQESELYRLLSLPQVRRCCIDSTGLGKQLAERAKEKFGWKVEPVTFTAQVKSDLAYPLRRAHEDRLLRYYRDDLLRNDLRGIKKEVTVAGNERFVGETGDSHCDRFWAKALAVLAAKPSAVQLYAEIC
jgi:phage FluMu gp28-like protein